MAKKFDAKAKAKKQKIIAAVLGVLLLGVLAYEVPSLMKSMNKKPPATTVAAPVTPAPGLAPVVGGPVAVDPLGVPVATTLSDSDPPAQAESGQLLSFDRFSSKDPFVQQVDATAGTTPSAAPKPGKASPPKVPSTIPSTPSQPVPPSNPTAARISVNGTSELVEVGKTFPSADPVFRLFSLTRTTVKIAIAGGSLSSGDGTTTLTRGKKVTLMNTADGTRYVLVLLGIS